ncbi:MAG: putative hydroxymethylpyrimidine transport system substrate-binding protein [Thermoleophilaceae bacterium]|nr:putative hydroxymethylpyrimidine transport system substrate-binding protein [Thermoleophilaceae bacterium]
MRGCLAAALATALCLTLAACGGDDGDERRGVVVALDFTPNAVHAPIYTARREGLDEDEDVRISIRAPGSAPDALKLVASGRADLGVLDIHDLALAAERGADVVGIGALVQRPLAAIIARDDVRRPRDLEGRRVGVSGLPSDVAVLRAVMEGDGARLDRVDQVTIGFAAVPNLVQRKIDAVPAFWNVEGVTLRRRGVPIREFRVDDFGAPRYPEVVLFTSRRTLERRRDAVEAALRAIGAGIDRVLENRDAAAREIAKLSGADLALVRAQLDAVAPALRPVLRLDRPLLDRWADFDERFGIVERRPDIDRLFEFGLAP